MQTDGLGNVSGKRQSLGTYRQRRNRFGTNFIGTTDVQDLDFR
jgi:hypothetical protein